MGFDQIAALADAKRLLQEAVLLPLILPHFFTGIMKPWKGVLLHGPPGTGKTMLSRALASASNTTFFNVSASLIVSKFRGESEKMIQTLFRVARHYAPSLIFLDEVDSVASTRKDSDHEASRSLKSSLLSEMDGISSNGESGAQMVMVLATSNRPWDLDEAMRRRLEKRIYIPLPDEAARSKLFAMHLGHVPVAEDVSMLELAKLTPGYSGHDILLLCRDASLAQFRLLVENLSNEEITALRAGAALEYETSRQDLMATLARVQASSGDPAAHTRYQEWQDEFGST